MYFNGYYLICVLQLTPPSCGRFGKEEDIHPLAFQPFGAGPRNCIGQRFAKLYIKLAWTRVLQKYRVEFCKPGNKKRKSYYYIAEYIKIIKFSKYDYV
ncbi:CYP3A4 [Cordylochernes scorpioides]|uniref:CYP3A4 n=1 Tax=Cordylochernes scorpioides TaxID=51811 RepID=A0ABY6K291_9ARAC|nr:CYP3A4 [Cordylochernes scorpioides]